jgi:TonB family protein
MRSKPGAARRGAVAGCALLLVACAGDEPVLEGPVPMPDPSPIEYPAVLWDMNVEGETEVLIHINALGDVDSVLVSRTSGYVEFDSAAVEGARLLRFTPGRRGDRRVAVWTKLPVRFAQDSTAAFGAPTVSGERHE